MHRMGKRGLRTLSSAADLDVALRESHEHPVLLFKHSRACGRSQRALERLLGAPQDE